MSYFRKSINNNKDSIIILNKGESGNKIYGNSGLAFGGHL